MRIGVISDTHGNIAALDKALKFFEGADLIVHAGDVLYHPPKLGWTDGYDVPAFVERLNALDTPVVVAQGNCDAQVYEELLKMPVQSPYALVEFDGVRIVAAHGHLLSRQEMIETARRYRASCFISGHTHVPELDVVDGVVLMNPGSPALPKHELGGRPVPTVGVITESGAMIINITDGSTVVEVARPGASAAC